MRRVGVLTFLDAIGRVVHEKREAWIDEERECAVTRFDGSIPLEDVLGAYETVTQAAEDLTRCQAEADRIGDAKGYPHPYPYRPLCFDVVMHHSPMHSFELRTGVAVSPADEYTRDFVRRRPVFFARLAKNIGLRGSLITPQRVGTMAYRLAEELAKKWPDTQTRCVVRTRVV